MAVANSYGKWPLDHGIPIDRSRIIYYDSQTRQTDQWSNRTMHINLVFMSWKTFENREMPTSRSNMAALLAAVLHVRKNARKDDDISDMRLGISYRLRCNHQAKQVPQPCQDEEPSKRKGVTRLLRTPYIHGQGPRIVNDFVTYPVNSHSYRIERFCSCCAIVLRYTAI